MPLKMNFPIESLPWLVVMGWLSQVIVKILDREIHSQPLLMSLLAYLFCHFSSQLVLCGDV